MAGPGSMLRVNGFRGGRLPPKGQIQQIRFRRNMFAADTHEPGFVSIDITTKPGIDNWRGSTSLGFRDAALTARNVFAPVKGDEQHERYGFSLSGPLWKQHTSLSLVGRRHRRVRHQDDRRGAAVGLLRRFDPQAERLAQRHRALRAHADQVADAPRRAAAQPHEGGQPRRRRLRPDRARLQPGADRDRACAGRTPARSARRCTTSCARSGWTRPTRSRRPARRRRCSC